MAPLDIQDYPKMPPFDTTSKSPGLSPSDPYPKVINPSLSTCGTSKEVRIPGGFISDDLSWPRSCAGKPWCSVERGQVTLTFILLGLSFQRLLSGGCKTAEGI